MISAAAVLTPEITEAIREAARLTREAEAAELALIERLTADSDNAQAMESSRL